MTLLEYIKGLNTFLKENPNAAELQVVTSKDDEGNGFCEIIFSPTKGFFEEGDFINYKNLSEYNRDEDDINAVCVN